MSCDELGVYVIKCLKQLSGEREEIEEIPVKEKTYDQLITLLLSKASPTLSISKSQKRKGKKKSQYLRTRDLVQFVQSKKKRVFIKKDGNQIKQASDVQKVPIIEELPWTILPRGEWNIEKLIAHFKGLTSKNNWRNEKPFQERLQKIFGFLQPSHCYIGEKQFEGYVIFCFDYTEKVVLECPFYGNAIYIIKGDWQKIAKMSKWEARYEHSSQVTVINHTETWLERLTSNLKNRF